MKIIVYPLLLLLSHAVSTTAQLLNEFSLDDMEMAFEVMRATENIDNVIADFEMGAANAQPVCSHPTGNYVKCMTISKNIDDTTFVIHPIVAFGTTLRSLKGTPDYEMGKGMIEAIVASVTVDDCGDAGNFGLATYPWLNKIDFNTPVVATSLAKDFTAADGNRYVCASGPLFEVPAEDTGETDDVTEPEPEPEPELEPVETSSGIPEFVWREAPPEREYDFVGTLEFCGGKATEMDWPDYLRFQQQSNEVFGYRQFGMNQGLPCGEEMAPLIRLQPGKTYKINFINSSESSTNLHTHGLHIGGNAYSGDVMRTIPPGMCGVYIWEVIEDHASGMHWYRPHNNKFTFEQVRGRGFGPIFVDEPEERLASYPTTIQKWLQNEIIIQMSSDTAPSPTMFGDGVKDGRCEGGFDECYPRANNKKLATFDMIKDEWYAVNLQSISPNGGTGNEVLKFFDESGRGEAPCETLIAGYDGIYRSKVPRRANDYKQEKGLFYSSASSRLLLAVKCSANASLKLGQDEATISYYDVNDPEVPILVQFNVVEGDTTEAAPYDNPKKKTQWVPPRPRYLADLTTWTGRVDKWDLTAEMKGLGGPVTGWQPLFNGQSFSVDENNYDATFGFVQEWSFFGTAGAPEGHPIHVHVNHLQILGSNNEVGTDCGPNLEFGEWYDTIRISDPSMDPCKARFRFNNYSGKVMLYCHDLMFQDAGMMGWVMVEGGPQDPFALDIAAALECINIL